MLLLPCFPVFYSLLLLLTTEGMLEPVRLKGDMLPLLYMQEPLRLKFY